MTAPDTVYRWSCGEVFVDEQLADEVHLADAHDRCRDDLDPILNVLQ